jgi:transposase-like protein
MAQHFLLSAEARNLSILKIATMSDEDVLEIFKQIRWSDTDGKPVCPCCGSIEKHYYLKTRKQYRCKECFHTFSVTSGTLFASHKKDLKVYLLAIALFTNSAKSISALQLSRDLDIQYKTAWVLSHKIRESLMEYHDNEKLSGVCEVDGVYVNGYIRPKNQKDKRVDRRKVHKPNKRTIISIRQRANIGDDVVGAVKTRTFVTRGETTSEIKDIVFNTVELGSEIHADEHNGYDHFHGHFDMQRVNHSEEYKSIDGACNNQSESYNARFRRMQHGNMHKLGNLYLSNYANEIAYREDTRRWSNGKIFNDILTKCLQSNTSNEFCGYWQGNKRVAERLGA